MNNLERHLPVLLRSSLSIYNGLSLTKPNLFCKYVDEMVCFVNTLPNYRVLGTDLTWSKNFPLE